MTVNGTLDFNGKTDVLGYYAGDGSIILGGTNILDLGTATNTFSGVVSGAGGITLRGDRKSTRLNSSHLKLSRMPSSA